MTIVLICVNVFGLVVAKKSILRSERISVHLKVSELRPLVVITMKLFSVTGNWEFCAIYFGEKHKT